MRDKRELTPVGAGNGKPVSGKAGHQETEQRLRPLAFNAAVDVDRGVGEVRRIAGSLGKDGDIGAAGLTLHLDGGAGGGALTHRGQADADIERREARKLFRFGDAFAKAEKLGGDLEPVGGQRLDREIRLPCRRRAQVRDAAIAVQRDGARRGEVEALDVEIILGEAEFRVETAGWDVGQQKLADAQCGVHLVVAERTEQALIGGGRRALCCARIGQPALPCGALAHDFAQIEAVAVEHKIDHAVVAAAIMQRAAELRAAQLAACVLELEIAAADDGLGGEGESAGRRLTRHVAGACGPTDQRLELGAVERDGAFEHRAALALRQAPGGLDAI